MIARARGPAACVVAALSAACAEPPAPMDAARSDKGKAILERTKSTRATYALYSWTVMEGAGGRRAEWGAEFHDGNRHRVETPGARVIADCASGAGAIHVVATGEVSRRDRIGDDACGIATGTAVASIRSLGKVETSFGPADRVEVTDASFVRTYDVSPEGVLLRSTYALRPGASGPMDALVSVAVAVEPTLPAADIFEVSSLDRFMIPHEYRRAPPESGAW